MKFWRVRPVCLIRVLVTSAVLTFIYYSWNSLRSSHGQKRHLRLGPRHDNFKIKPPVNPMGDTSHAKEFDLMSLAMVNSPEDQKIRDEGYWRYSFNQLVSDRIGHHRPLPDTRHPYCQRKEYLSQLPKVSIIICFYNELLSALLRTVYSVLDRSPEQLIHEIVLVDDASEFEELGHRLQQHVKDNLPIVKFVRATERQGLIRARNFGVEHATGEVVVFLDSHCEVNTGWLEPLLAHVALHQHNVAIPMIDIIDPDTFRYEPSPLRRGGFTWAMQFSWDPIPRNELVTKEDYVKPVRSPTMAGGLFAMDREYFMELGMYDPGMEIWGGENLEISFRVWQCGGQMYQIPCSRVGHISRKRRPYPDGDETMIRNSLRVAHVWMDDYKLFLCNILKPGVMTRMKMLLEQRREAMLQLHQGDQQENFFKVRPNARSKSFGDITDRIALRRRLKCHNFKWYLDNVYYPTQSLPDDQGPGPPLKRHIKPVVLRQGYLQHLSSGLCVISDQSPGDKRSLLKLAQCDYGNSEQQWSFTKKEDFRLAGLLCLDGSDVNLGRSFPLLMKCTELGATQAWHWIGESKQLLLNAGSGQCLSVMKEEEDAYLNQEICDTGSSRMKFHFV